MKKPKHLWKMMPLFLAILIDGMGLGVLFPVLNTILIDQKHTILPATMNAMQRDMLYGCIVGVFMLAWFFGAAILGDYSDGYGRKKALVICLLGSSFGYFISALGIMSGNLWLLTGGRVIDGFTAGSQPIAQAAVIDLSEESEGASNMGAILFAGSLGFILGPLFGGLFTINSITKVIGYTGPLYFAGCIAALNALLIYFFFSDKEQEKREVTINLTNAIHLFTSAFKHTGVRKLSIILLVFILGWSTYFTFIDLYLLHHFKATPLVLGLFMSTLAVGFGIGTGYLIDPLTQRFEKPWLVLCAAAMSCMMIAVSVAGNKLSVIWALSMPLGATVAVLYTCIIMLFSEQVSETEQGWVMGVTGSIMAAGFAISSFALAFAAGISVTFTLLISASLFALTALLEKYLQKASA